MSRNNNKKIAIVSVSTKFCKVCKDAGKSDYTSHYIKDSTGKVCCPYLLGLVCGYCGITGHTPKFCPALKCDEKKITFRENTAKYQEKITSHTSRISNIKVTRFAAAFGDSDSDDEKVNIEVVEEYPEIRFKPINTDCYGRVIKEKKSTNTTTSTSTYTFMDALLNPNYTTTTIKLIPEPAPVKVVVVPDQAVVDGKTYSLSRTKQAGVAKKYVNWADCSDSDSD